MNKMGLLIGLALAALFPACAHHSHNVEVNIHRGLGALTEAVAVVHPTRGNHCRGVVRFTQVENGLRIVADLEDLAPNSIHAFHIHQYGDCTADNAMSAGSHYDPEKTAHHGSPSDAHRHAGDLGNVTADSQGRVHLDLVQPDLTIGGNNAVLGRSVIVHEKADDLVSQPAGNAGARIGCGVIGIAQPGGIVAAAH